MQKRHEVKPFEDTATLIHTCDKHNTALFVLGNHSKKRPQNLIFGRLYDSKLLDMVELGIDSYTAPSEFHQTASVPRTLKPLIIFQGEHFEYSDPSIKLRNLLSGTARE